MVRLVESFMAATPDEICKRPTLLRDGRHDESLSHSKSQIFVDQPHEHQPHGREPSQMLLGFSPKTSSVQALSHAAKKTNCLLHVIPPG